MQGSASFLELVSAGSAPSTLWLDSIRQIELVIIGGFGGLIRIMEVRLRGREMANGA